MTNINRRRFPILLASALALLAILGALFLPDRAQAQAQTIVLVSNMGLTAATDTGVPINNNERAKGFSTASSSAGGYNLTSVELDVHTVPAGIDHLVVQIWSSTKDTTDVDVPNASVVTLNNPTALAVGLNTFTAPANTVLDAGTIYFVFVSNSAGEAATPSQGGWRLKRNSGGGPDSTGQTGWDLENGFARGSAGSWFLSSSQAGRMRLRVNGSAAGGDPPPLSTDATLSGLSLGTGVTLSPAFASGTDTYTASVANSVDEVTVTPTTNHASATVEILDTDDNELDDADDVEDDFQVALSVGDTVIKVKVTAEDGTSTQTYTVTVTRAAEMTPDDPPDDSGNVSEPDGEDLPADTTTTGQVEVGGSVTGTIADTIDDLSSGDSFKVDLEAGKRYQIDVEGAPTGRGTLPDPWLASIVDPDGNLVQDAGDNDGGVGLNARLILTPTEDGAHDVNVRAYFLPSAQQGTYTLSVIYLGANGVSEADTDFPYNNTTSGRVEVGASVTGNTVTGDTDWFRVDLEAGKTYQIDLEGADGGRGTLADPLLSFFDTSGSIITTNDDKPANLDSQLVETATATGTWYLGAGGSVNETGTYTLSVRDITPATCTLNTGDVWCGVVTVGMFTLSGTSYLGYLDGTGGGGMLSDNDFDFTDTELDSKSQTITGVLLVSGTLSLVFEDSQDEDDKPVLDTWDLQVGTDTFALDDDDVTQLPTGGYQWTGTGLSWSAGDTVTLRLRGETGPPSVANVAVTSMPLLTSSGGSEQDTYGAGDEIEFTVTFSQVVVVTGDPQFGFSLSRARQADYRSGSGSTALKFVYTVQSSDSDDDGIWIGNHNSNTKSLQLDANDEITSPGGIDANLEHDQKQVQAGHKVDGSRSSKPTLSIADAVATEGSNVSFTVTLSAAAATTVTATWTASIETGDTAVAADLGATKTGTVEITAGDTDATITVATVEDTTVEVNETFTVTLSGVSSNAQLSSTAATAQGTINNDDLATALDLPPIVVPQIMRH